MKETVSAIKQELSGAFMRAAGTVLGAYLAAQSICYAVFKVAAMSDQEAALVAGVTAIGLAVFAASIWATKRAEDKSKAPAYQRIIGQLHSGSTDARGIKAKP